ncbi:MAG: hypothetical protein EBR09_00865 [Proteobacteria bacterium]|nr:hypothetical protein [Pseudomonadota bacterium]
MVHPKLNEVDSLRTIVVKVPAKAMLFGEYGVLRGGAAVTAILPAHSFRVGFTLTDAHETADCGIEFESALFSESVVVQAELLGNPECFPANSDHRKLCCYVTGFADRLKNKKLKVRVLESYSPALGFGSSSALIVAFQRALGYFFNTPENDVTPQNLYRSLLNLQGKGSGYDVAAQSWAVAQDQTDSPRVTYFRNTGFAGGEFVPEVNQIPVSLSELKKLGCFVRTGVLSDTTAILKQTSQLQNLNEFCALQSECASRFLSMPTAENAAELCRRSAVSAQQAGLLPESADVIDFVRALEQENIAWKTMGAGHGDCLWVVESGRRIEEILRRTDSKALSISFAFAGKD